MPSVACRAWLALCLGHIGEYSEAIAWGGEGVRIAETAAGPQERVWAYYCLGRVHLERGDANLAIATARASRPPLRRGALPDLLSAGSGVSGRRPHHERPSRRRAAAAGAGRGRGAGDQAGLRSPGGPDPHRRGASRGRPAGRGPPVRRASARPREPSGRARRRGARAPPPGRDRQPRGAVGERAGARELRGGSGPRRGARDGAAPGPVSPGPRRCLPAGGTGRGGAG